MTTRPDALRTTEAYTFALAPVIGPFFEALGAVLQNIANTRDNLNLDQATLKNPDDH